MMLPPRETMPVMRLRGERNEAQQHARVDGEIIHALLCLFDQRVAINFPGEFLGLAADFFERLINRHGADGHGRIAQNPFARGVDVLAGGQIHDGVRAPLGRPTHFLNFLFDARRDGAVADVGIDLHEEVAANDHRLKFRMIDVRRNDGAAGGDFGADKFRRDFFRNALRKASENGWRNIRRTTDCLAGELPACCLPRSLRLLSLAQFRNPQFAIRNSHVLADGDEFHLRRDDALLRIPQLRDRMTFARAQAACGAGRAAREIPRAGFFPPCWRTPRACRKDSRCPSASPRVRRVPRRHRVSKSIRGAVRAGLPRFAGECGVAPWPAAIINAHGRIFLDRTGVRLGVAHGNLAHGHPHLGMNLACDINPFAVGQLLAAMRFERFFGGDHKLVDDRELSLTANPQIDSEMLFKKLAHAVPSLRQHYLDQFFGSFGVPRETLSLRRPCGRPVGSPNDCQS